MIAYVFPGQGAQTVGMGKDLYDRFPEARAVIDAVESRSGLPLKRLMWEGPADDLTATQHAQVALFACGVAAFKVLEAQGAPPPTMVAGHSLGEYTALVAAGALDLGPATDLVTLRGQSMAKAPPGTMAAVLGMDPDQLTRLCADIPGQVVVANYNTLDQLVVSGEVKAVEALHDAARRAGAKRVVMLNVGGAFHSPLMAPALGPLSAALREAPWKDATIPVVHNVDATPNQRADRFADRLTRQLESSVRWVDCVGAMRDAGIRMFVELGAGRTLAGLIRKIDRSLQAVVVEDGISLDKTLSDLHALAKEPLVR